MQAPYHRRFAILPEDIKEPNQGLSLPVLVFLRIVRLRLNRYQASADRPNTYCLKIGKPF
jgi:hypothetical protein